MVQVCLKDVYTGPPAYISNEAGTAWHATRRQQYGQIGLAGLGGASIKLFWKGNRRGVISDTEQPYIKQANNENYKLPDANYTTYKNTLIITLNQVLFMSSPQNRLKRDWRIIMSKLLKKSSEVFTSISILLYVSKNLIFYFSENS